MAIRILLADDHKLFRDGLKALLSREEFEVVAEASDGHQAVRLARHHQPDLALLDIGMPGLNGVDTAREILRVSPRTGIVVLTMHDEEIYVAEALRAGARGYVLKSQPVAELLRGLREVAAGQVHLASGYWRALLDAYQRGDRFHADPLSPREREVLQLVAEGKSTKEIAATLAISAKTAESHRGHIMSKLDIHETAGLVRYAIRNRLSEL